MHASQHGGTPEFVFYIHRALKIFEKSTLEQDVKDLIEEITFEVAVMLRQYRN